MPGAGRLLHHLHGAGVPMAVATSTPRRTYERKMSGSAGAGVAARFDACTCGDEVEQGKPAPDCFAATAARLGVHPSECLCFEDAPTGVEVRAQRQRRHARGMLMLRHLRVIVASSKVVAALLWECSDAVSTLCCGSNWTECKSLAPCPPQAATAAGMRVVVIPSLAREEYPKPIPDATSGVFLLST